MDQVRETDLSREKAAIAEMIVGNIDERGYLTTSVESLSMFAGGNPGMVDEILRIVQGFHPPGVGARDLRECLLLQLERAERETSLEYVIIDRHFELLSRRKFPELANALNRDDIDVVDVQKAA